MQMEVLERPVWWLRVKWYSLSVKHIFFFNAATITDREREKKKRNLNQKKSDCVCEAERIHKINIKTIALNMERSF